MLLATVSGCEALSVLLGDTEKPSVSLTGVHLEALNLTSATLLFDVSLSNPYAIDLPLAKLEYGFLSKGKQFLTGTADVAGSVPAKSSRVLSVPAKISFPELLKILDGVRPGSVVPYTANFVVSLDVPGGKTLDLPLRKEGELPVPTMPEITLEDVQWEGLSLEKATALLKLRVLNRNEFPLELSKLSYGLTLGTARIADSSVEQAVAFTAGGENTIEVRTSFAPKDLGLSAFTMLTGSGSSYKLGGTMNVTTPFGPLDLPYEGSGQAQFKK